MGPVLRRAAQRERFLTRTNTGQGVDWDALGDVQERGWVHSVEE